MPQHKKICIIGGGVMGVSLLYHLALEGCTDTVLIEKGELTSGSTWHAAGQVPNFIASLNMGKIHDYGVRLYPTLEKETGSPVSWHGCGGLRLALTDEEVDWFKYVHGVSKLIGYEGHLISPEEAKKYHPFLDMFGVKLVYYTVHDGHVDPSSITNAMGLGARNRGATIRRHTKVTDVSQTPSGEWHVTCDNGDDVICEQLVNAAGSYGHRICQWAGLKGAPITNMVHQYFVTENMPQIKELDFELPVVRDPYSHCYLRQEQNGILVGPYETSTAKGCFMDNESVPPWDFDMQLFEGETERLMPWLEKATERFPLFAEGGLKSIISGPITHTPDGNFLLGPAPLPNFWMACGASIGICQGGGAGKYLAQWMLHGQAEINMAEFDPRRFGDWAIGDYCTQKSIDDYQHMYHLHMPGEYREVARCTRTTPLYERHKAKGADFMQTFGWERPKCFSGGEKEVYSFKRSNFFKYVKEEYKAAREAAIVLDLSSFATYKVSGSDAENYLNRIIANKAPKVGRIGLGHLMNENAIIEGEITIAHAEEGTYTVFSGTTAEIHDLDIMQKAVGKGESVTVENATDDIAGILVSGPKAREILQPLTDTALDSNFPWLSCQNITIAGVKALAMRVSYIGELGWEFHCSAGDLVTLYDAVFGAGEQHGLKDMGFSALNHLRMEKGYRSMGAELTNELTLIEADMERFVGWDKGDFLGKSVLEAKRGKNDDEGIRLVYLQVDLDDCDCIGNEPVYHGGKLVGVTTSGGYGFCIDKGLAFAYVPPKLAKVGEKFDIMVYDEMRQAEVLPAPVYDPKNEKLRG